MDRKKLKAMVRTMYDYQDMRIRTAGRLRLKADGTPQDEENMSEAIYDERMYNVVETVKSDTQNIEKYLAKEIEKSVKDYPIWKSFLKNVKGCGPLMSAAIISEFDIHKADTVSKMWQFAGLNPGTVCGKKRVGENIIQTTDIIRGDKLTPGYVSPFNRWLRTKLVGVLAECMIKAKSDYTKYYYNIHTPEKRRSEIGYGRLDLSEKINANTGKKWKDESEGHRNNAAKRYMIKMFLLDLYVAWRTIEGLSVRKPYQEEYLGHVHAS